MSTVHECFPAFSFSLFDEHDNTGLVGMQNFSGIMKVVDILNRFGQSASYQFMLGVWLLVCFDTRISDWVSALVFAVIRGKI